MKCAVSMRTRSSSLSVFEIIDDVCQGCPLADATTEWCQVRNFFASAGR